LVRHHRHQNRRHDHGRLCHRSLCIGYPDGSLILFALLMASLGVLLARWLDFGRHRRFAENLDVLLGVACSPLADLQSRIE
jgi:hypothetical protein